MHHILFYTPFKLSTWNNEVLRFSTHHILHASQTHTWRYSYTFLFSVYHILHASQTQKEQSMVFCDLVLIIFYTHLKLPIRLLTSLPYFVPIVFYTHLKLYNDNDIRRKSFIAISFHTHLKLPSTIPVAIRHLVPIIFYTHLKPYPTSLVDENDFVPITFYTHLRHMNNLLYDLFCTRHILHTSQTYSVLVVCVICFLPIIFYTLLKPNSHNKHLHDCFVPIIFYTPLKHWGVLLYPC